MPEATNMQAQENTGAEPRAKSRGEKVFDRVVYAGIAGVVTFLVTLKLTHFLKYDHKAQFDKVVSGVHRGLQKIFPSLTRENADTITTTFALMQGGNAMLLPVAFAEKHKIRIVDGLNTALGDSTPAEQIEQAPKQTIGSLVKSRLVAFGAVVSGLLLAKKHYSKTMDMFEQQTGELLCDTLNKPQFHMEPKMVEGVQKLVKKESKTFIYGKLAALDIFATAAAASLLYVGGHFFARKREEKMERKERRQQGVQGKAAGVTAEPVMEAAQQPIASSMAAPLTQLQGPKAHEGAMMGSTPHIHAGVGA